MLKKWSLQEIEQLRILYKTKSAEECARVLGRSTQSVMGATIRYKIKSGRTGHFERGHTPFNKGLKGINYGGVETQFKKGNKPHNTTFDGAITERADGYLWIRVAENKWVQYHRYLWEQINGPLADDLIVTFKNGDKRDFRIENLEIITRRENALRNHNRQKASITMRELFRRERLRKKYGLSPISGHGNRIVNYY
jgi:hypothetical protein